MISKSGTTNPFKKKEERESSTAQIDCQVLPAREGEVEFVGL